MKRSPSHGIVLPIRTCVRADLLRTITCRDAPYVRSNSTEWKYFSWPGNPTQKKAIVACWRSAKSFEATSQVKTPASVPLPQEAPACAQTGVKQATRTMPVGAF